MIHSRIIVGVSVILFVAMHSLVFADDGEKTVKSMSKNADVTVTPDQVYVPTSEAEHAFVDMMKFYVPSQQASGVQLSIPYVNLDAGPVETLSVAKPLVSVFIYGPAIGVDGTAFAHSFMDVFGAVSLDDGQTWKTTNLSQSADQSSFVLGQSSGGSGGGSGSSGGGDTTTLPATHTESRGGVLHAPGFNTPYTSQCTDCHGANLRGGSAPSCYSCHNQLWDESNPIYSGPTIVESESEGSKLTAKGKDAPAYALVEIINAATKEVLGSDRASKSGEWEAEIKGLAKAPCSIAAVANGETSDPIVPDNTPKDCEAPPVDLTNYPGGAHNVVHVTQGNKVLVAWPSRYCDQGKPAYALKNDTTRRDAIVSFIQTGVAADGLNATPLPGFTLDDDLYLNDVFGVAGSQGSINFGDEGYPQAGEVPFGCVWTARGFLLAGDDPRTTEVEATHMVWTKAERLTSGRRDPFRIEVAAVKGAGFVITWQEDPEGLRPGQGEGPGQGWSGAVAHSQTDVWYSFINWKYFDYVDNGSGQPINIINHDLSTSGRPQVFVPMAMPMRMTNNAKCNTDGIVVTDPDPYCNFGVGDLNDGILDAADFGLKDQCADTVTIPTGPNNTPTPICVADINGDGFGDLPNVANTASTRPRTSLQGYDSDGDGVIDSAWVIVASEESKGLGRYFFLPDGTPCTEGSSQECEEDVGKNQWYFSFDMGTPDTSSDMSDTGLVKNLVSQGNLLNQPEIDWRTGEFYPARNTVDMWNFSGFDFDILNTEIARRSSLLVQSIAKANAGQTKLMAFPTWKQGAMEQGGPADTMARRIVDQGTSINPYAFTNMVCSQWAYTDDSNGGFNPYYPNGVCMDPATNLSSVVPDSCMDSQTGGQIPCPSMDFSGSTFGISDTNPILQGYTQGEGNTMRVLTWHQCPSDGTQSQGDITAVTCDNDTRTDGFVNLTDQSWYNPLDVAKGHRGFLDGDMVMFLYAWSPNWRLNAKGSDRYDLYVRRSFDGGVTWQTTPAAGTASDGVTPYAGAGSVSCETYRTMDTGSGSGGGIAEPRVCYQYPAGGKEQARNVTQHKSMRITTLDPRYSPTPATITTGCVDATDPTIDSGVMTCDDLSTEYDSDVRNPSRYFMVYETGDNTTVQAGEAEPLDLYYSRAINFGDQYAVWAEATDLNVCYPSDPHGDDVPTSVVGSGFCNEFDRMNAGGDTHSSEANLETNPNGSKMYGVWAQWVFDALGTEVVEADAMLRRVWWIDGYIPTQAWVFGQNSGGTSTTTP